MGCLGTGTWLYCKVSEYEALKVSLKFEGTKMEKEMKLLELLWPMWPF